MYGVSISKLLSPTPQNFFVVAPNLFPFSLCHTRYPPVNSALTLRYGVFTCFVISPPRKRSNWCVVPRASRGESPYELLGVSPSATSDQIKRAYRKLALKYHPDVNKEANAQEKFLRIKHAYTTLMNSDSRRRFESENRASDFSYGQRRQSSNKQTDEDFYGFGEFLRDVQITVGDFFRELQEEFKNWEATTPSQGKPKSLWEELGEIGEEFVEFLEKELNINEEEGAKESQTKHPSETTGEVSGKSKSSIEDNIDEIEAALSQLKKELGL